MSAVRAFVADMQTAVDRTDKEREHVLTVTKHILLDQLDKSDPPVVCATVDSLAQSLTIC